MLDSIFPMKSPSRITWALWDDPWLSAAPNWIAGLSNENVSFFNWWRSPIGGFYVDGVESCNVLCFTIQVYLALQENKLNSAVQLTIFGNRALE